VAPDPTGVRLLNTLAKLIGGDKSEKRESETAGYKESNQENLE